MIAGEKHVIIYMLNTEACKFALGTSPWTGVGKFGGGQVNDHDK